VQLTGTTMTVVVAVIGSLAGAISYLLKALLAAKDVQIASVTREMEQQRAVMIAQIETLKLDRDYFRELVMGERAARSRRRPTAEEDDDDATPGGPRRLDRR